MNFLCPRKLPTLTFVRYSRPNREKLQKPEDKSLVILGKTKPSVAFPKPGISDKTLPIHVKWDRPVMVETVNPQVSGDIGGLEHFGQVDLSQPPVQLENSKALETATEDVKRVLSLDFARRRDVMEKLSQEVLKSVQMHPRDFDSLEVRITIATIKIRNIQHELVQLYPYKNQPVKHVLTHKISHRRKMLSKLREKDYKKYEWLLEKLNLLYKPMPHDAPDGVLVPKENVERKASIERLTSLWCDELRRHRLRAYQRHLVAGQPDFLLKKAEKLRHILKEEQELGLDQTVTEEEIEECLKKAEDVKAILEGPEYHEDEEYLIYKEEVKRAEHTYAS
eukprot:GFUD01039307.1.p1 GENE.GFUD01039307.1~~GFUD01039307.1.p1  ORF type:complete len:336 (-),score=75.02 GFUD01039307.1:34-1041(-)